MSYMVYATPFSLKNASLFEFRKEDVGGHGGLVDGNADGLEHRVADGRGGGTGGGRPQGLGAVGAGALRVLHEQGPEMRVVHEGGELVVQQVVVQGPAGLFIEEELLAEGVADAHGHAAVDLSLRQGGVDELAA